MFETPTSDPVYLKQYKAAERRVIYESSTKAEFLYRTDKKTAGGMLDDKHFHEHPFGKAIPESELLPKLETEQQKRLSNCMAVVKANLKGFVEAGRALAEIRDNKLYRQTHRTFESFCRDNFDISRPRAYELIDASEVVTELSGIPDKEVPLPQNVDQARELENTAKALRI